MRSISMVRCRVAELSPINGMGFVCRRHYTASSWRAVDCAGDDGGQFRVIYHYQIRMGEFFRDAAHGPWEFQPISTGWGSKSDQQGMNQIMRGTGWYLRRAGGARYERQEVAA